MDQEQQLQMLIRKVLLVCGILSSLLYIGTDILGGMLWEGYSLTTQTISALDAIGSPTRILVAPLFFIYDVLLIAFGLGAWGSARRNRYLRITAGLLTGITVVSLMSSLFPMYLGEPIISLANAMHSFLYGVIEFLILLSMGFGAIAYRNWFRYYSIGTILIFILSGVLGLGSVVSEYLTGVLGLGLAASENLTSWLGIFERINVYGYLLWVAVLAIILLRTEKWPGSQSQSSANEISIQDDTPIRVT